MNRMQVFIIDPRQPVSIPIPRGMRLAGLMAGSRAIDLAPLIGAADGLTIDPDDGSCFPPDALPIVLLCGRPAIIAVILAYDLAEISALRDKLIGIWARQSSHGSA